MGKAATLYRALLRAHKTILPNEMRQLGDAYVKAEFHRHKTAKPEHVVGFYDEWEKYLQQLHRQAEQQALVKGFGKELPADVSISQEQEVQLRKLRQETEKSGKSSS